VQAAADGGSRPMLVFDQFEELVTLFEEARSAERLQRGRESQSAVVDVLVELLTLEHLPVKIVLSFREDYLAKVKTLLRKRPELVDQSMHLAPPQTDALYEIIRGPFERFPDRFERELTPEFAGKLADAIASRGELGTVNLSELQVVCFRLWSADEPERLFQERGLQGIVEDSVFQAINGFPEDLRYAALSVLTQMVTGSGVRTVISADDIVERVREDEPIGETQIREALRRLEKDTRLVRRERRREIEVYEIMSEFLVPWISWLRERRLESVRASEAAQIRRWHEDLRRARGLEEAGTEEGLRDAVRIATSLLIQSRYADFEVANGAWAVLHRLAEPHQATSVRKAAGHGIAAARSMEDELTPYLSEVLPYPAGMEESRPVVFQQRSLAKMVGVFAVLTLQAAATVFVTYAVIAAVLDLAGWSVDVPPLLVPGIVLAVGWGSLYTLEAIDWGNEHLNGLSAPYRPYREGIGIWEQWSGWPTNFVLPWVLAYAGAAAASGVGVDSRYAFYAVLGVASLAALRSYREAVLLF